MKKFTKISLIIAAVFAGVGVLFCGISSVMGAGYRTIYQMARNGELNRGNWHINEHGIYYNSGDEISIDVDEDGNVNVDSGENWHIDGQGVYYSNDEIAIDVDEDGNVDVEIGMVGVPGTESNESTSYVADEEVHHVDGSSYVYNIAEINNLDIDIHAASLFFETGESTDTIVVTLENGREKYFSSGISSDTLEIEYDTKNNIHLNDNNVKITIEIPAGMTFDEMDMDMGATNAEFELTDVSCNTLKMDIGAGNVIADAFEVKELFRVTVGAGNVDISGGSYKNIKIDCGMGNFTMKGKLAGDIDADCGMGNMDLRLEGDEDAYNYALSCGMGELKVNGMKYSSIAGDHKVTNAGAVGTIDLDCGMGSIELEIE